MNVSTPDLCDAYPDLTRILEPIFKNYVGKTSFGGEIVTVKCFEDNSRVKENAGKAGQGKVMVVDGGGSYKKALLGDLIAETALITDGKDLLFTAAYGMLNRLAL